MGARRREVSRRSPPAGVAEDTHEHDARRGMRTGAQTARWHGRVPVCDSFAIGFHQNVVRRLESSGAPPSTALVRARRPIYGVITYHIDPGRSSVASPVLHCCCCYAHRLLKICDWNRDTLWLNSAVVASTLWLKSVTEAVTPPGRATEPSRTFVLFRLATHFFASFFHAF